MKTIGLLGGMSWESTAIYYRAMNECVRDALGGHHSARILLHSVDFHDHEAMQRAGDWAGIARALGAAGHGLKLAGADFLVLATNTMHKLATEIEAKSGLDLLHIADPTGEALRNAGHRRVALIGTRFTMEHDFYRHRLRDRHGLSVLVPDDDERAQVHSIIYDELCQGVVRESSRVAYEAILGRLRERGAECAIMGCTEITMLLDPRTSPLPLFDTTRLHAEAAVRRAIGSRQ
ncbi:aspartate racemase [Hoeflea marina]|uniref:Aspartate racemase n=1 Tax=Hoeflea marina TaxID=274592 RepID=A0A317PEV5_9HYPH|nr:aspartate/glutamate racemase family protein [Hoeflea marina]PWV98349.1 aspartate racemase [Hoeflea marina]